jgi:hypothetical protein
MAEENIKEFTINWITVGLLTFCLMSFAVTFMFYNNPIGLGDNADSVFSQTTTNLSGRLTSSDVDADKVLNITANTNPEASELGSRDSVASAYQTKGTGTGFFESMKIFIAWVFVGSMGQMLISVLGGIVGFTSVYFIVKWIRNGI